MNGLYSSYPVTHSCRQYLVSQRWSVWRLTIMKGLSSFLNALSNSNVYWVSFCEWMKIEHDTTGIGSNLPCSQAPFTGNLKTSRHWTIACGATHWNSGHVHRISCYIPDNNIHICRTPWIPNTRITWVNAVCNVQLELEIRTLPSIIGNSSFLGLVCFQQPHSVHMCFIHYMIHKQLHLHYH